MTEHQAVFRVNNNNIKMAIKDNLLLSHSDSIIYCLSSTSHYSKIFLRNGRYILFEKRLKHIEEVLSQKQFIRVNASCLVNVKFIKNVKYAENKGVYLVLEEGTELEVSGRKLQGLVQELAKKSISLN